MADERDAAGRYLQTEQTDDLDRKAVALFRKRYTYRQIAAELGISLGSAHQRVERSMKKAIVPGAEEALAMVVDRLQTERGGLEDIRAQLLADFERGRQIPVDPRDPDSELVDDPEHRLKVADRLIKISDQLQKNDESLRRLMGLDQPAKTQVSGELRYELIGVNPAEHLT